MKNRSHSPQRTRRYIPWNWAALLAPIVGYFCALVVGFVGERFLWGEKYWTGFFWGLAAWAVVSLVGLAAAGRSLFLKERFWGLTAFGIVLNSPLPLLFLYGFLYWIATFIFG